MPRPEATIDAGVGSTLASFGDRLHERMRSVGSAVCLGIDPRPAAHPLTHPERFAGDPAGVAKAVVALYRSVLEAGHGRLACVKPQAAFFEALGIPGMIALAQLIADARSLGLPVILDAKRGDVGSTAEAYAAAYLGDGVWSADAMTVSPYLGPDTLEPFLDAARSRGRGAYTLVATSNPGARTWQDAATVSGRMVHECIADHLQRVATEHGRYASVGAVVGATRGERLGDLRERMPDVFFLVPGYGTQGGRADDVAQAFDADGLGAVVSASRSLMPAADAADHAAAGADARDRIEAMADAIEAAKAKR